MENKGYITYSGLRYSKDNVSVLVIIDARRPKKNGLYPVRIQVVANRVQRFYPTSKDLSLDDWEKLPDSQSKRLISIRGDIKNTFDKIEEVVKELCNEGIFSFDVLNKRLGKGTSDTVNTAFKAKIANLENEGRAGTQAYYNIALNSITKFKGDKIKFSEITPDWLRNYGKYLRDEGKTSTTVGMYTRAIRSIINEAKSNGIIKESQYPFGKGKYKPPTGEGRKLAFTLQQIGKIVRYTDGTETKERYRDLWFFSYLCSGINFADLLRLKYSNIVGDEIYFFRQKTILTSKSKREIKSVITPEMQTIIDRWGNAERKPENYIFPYLKGNETPMQAKKIVADIVRRVNRKMKTVAKVLGIDGFSTYAARHSFATVMKRSGASVAYISEQMGHPDVKTTENYLASFEKDERIKHSASLTKFDAEEK